MVSFLSLCFLAAVLVGRAGALRGCDHGKPRQGPRECRAGLALPQPDDITVTLANVVVIASKL
ncbi:hypothetical protein PF005_g1543 [Phytophthora fragariae]|uniref:RxLR effector protein n=1 Tax=Phytophthora fragariae TaxID=53985 RepID=A0A6A4EVW0_9STRA|nr:hypothetical protein PF003_g1894 [Phytophthora fragariae]KAE8945974.1 hypothetical protein PF009_g4379 [Phytophthora fragariae]KAE9011149.1 hypothetical protein PF011_g9497 [Phytophthora fragariae]KAE9131400.1 hypothetical protein PF010_g3503 [Phytophthora fragariae]KAE9131510.1 hypothetical protein PF007_g4107 [Phytophthora fragariae]